MYYQFKLDGYTFQDLMALNRAMARLYRRGRTAASRTVRFFMGLLMLAMSSLVLVGGISIPLGIMLVVLGVVYLCLAVFHYRLSAWHSSRLQLKDAGELTVTLDDTGVREHGRKGEGFYPYASFIGCAHSRERYFLFLDKRHAVILPEAAIAVGDPAALGAKLAEKFDGSIQEV